MMNVSIGKKMYNETMKQKIEYGLNTIHYFIYM